MKCEQCVGKDVVLDRVWNILTDILLEQNIVRGADWIRQEVGKAVAEIDSLDDEED